MKVIGDLMFGALCGLIFVLALVGAVFIALMPHLRLVP